MNFLSQESFIDLLDDAYDRGVLTNYDIEKKSSPPWWLEMLPMIAMVVLFVFFWIFFVQQSQGGGNRVMSFGKSRARMANEDSKMRVRFSDVAGADEEKEELREIVEF